MNRQLVFALVAVEGLCSLGIEVVALRRIVPYVGSSITITAPTIALFLAALALGYHRASRIGTAFDRRVVVNFIAAALFAGVGLSAWYAALVFALVPERLLALAIYLVTAMAPPAFLLAQTVPVLSNELRGARAGHSAGVALAWSTAGSVISALGLSLVVMQLFGLRWAVVLAAAPLATMAAVTARRLVDGHRLFRASIVTLGTVAMVNLVPTPFVLAETAYADYVVLRQIETTTGSAGSTLPIEHFVINQQSASTLDAGEPRQRAAYIEYLSKVLRSDLRFEGKHILVLGAGGFTLGLGDDANSYTYVDIDPQVKALAEAAFLGKPARGAFVVGDARRYVMQTDRRYDAIVVDTFASHVSIPSHLVTVEFWRGLPRALVDGGVVLVNVVADPQLASAFATRMLRTIDTAIGPCTRHVLEPSALVSNVEIVCRAASRRPRPATDNVYTDELNRVDLDRSFKGH